MKRLFRSVFIAFVAIACGQALASGSDRPYFGAYLLGGSYSLPTAGGDVRFGVGLPVVLFGAGFFEGSVSLIRPGSEMNGADRWAWHYGAGVGALVATAGGDAVALVRPYGLVGLTYDAGPVTPYVELNAGPLFALGDGASSSVVLAPGVRIGAYFR